MGHTNTFSLWRLFPLVVVATLLIAGLPVVIVWGLDLSGTIESPLLLAGLGFVAALLLAKVGRSLWETRPASADLLFNELMLWGWLRRLRIERRLSNAVDLLGVKPGRPGRRPPKLDADRRAGLLTGLAETLEARDPYLHGHSRRVARHSSMIAKKLGLPKQDVAMIRTAAAVHDVGKLETPIEILHKPGRLTDEEFEIIKLHSTAGEQLVRPVFGDELAEIVAHHHERLDGTGYPDGLAGDEIPLGARIIAVADTFDAICSTRPYRSAKTHKLALGILQKEAGTQLDPDAVKAFCSCYSGIRPLTVWATLSTVPQRLILPMLRDAHAAGGAAAKVMAATAASAAIGSAAIAHTDLSESLRTAGSNGGATTRAATASVVSLPSSRHGWPVFDLPERSAADSRDSRPQGDDSGGDSASAPSDASSNDAGPAGPAPIGPVTEPSTARPPSQPAGAASTPGSNPGEGSNGNSESSAHHGDGGQGQGAGNDGGQGQGGQGQQGDQGQSESGGQNATAPPSESSTPPAQETTVPPNDGSTPPAQETTVPPNDAPPPGGGTVPPGHGGTPPGLGGGVPPGHGGTPPGLGGGVPPGQGGTPPGQGGTPPGQGGTPPGQGGTPPGQGGTPPGQDGTVPPGQEEGGTPGHGGTPPGHGGTPPGQDDEGDEPDLDDEGDEPDLDDDGDD